MIRYCTQRFLSDHFNFIAFGIGTGILNEGIFGRHSLDESGLEQSVYSAMKKNDVLLDECIDVRPYLQKYTVRVAQVIGRAKRRLATDGILGNLACVWHSVRVSKTSLKAYRKNLVDLVFVESYWPWKSRLMMWLFFGLNYRRAERMGIESRIVFVFGSHPGHPKFNVRDVQHWWDEIPWADDLDVLTRQCEYVSSHCRSIAGVGVFLIGSDQEWLAKIDNTLLKYFPDRVLGGFGHGEG